MIPSYAITYVDLITQFYNVFDRYYVALLRKLCSLALAPILLPILFCRLRSHMLYLYSRSYQYPYLTNLQNFGISTCIDNIYALLLCIKMVRLMLAHVWAHAELKTYFLLEDEKQVIQSWNQATSYHPCHSRCSAGRGFHFLIVSSGRY